MAYAWRCTVRHALPCWRIVHCAVVISLSTICGAMVSYSVRYWRSSRALNEWNGFVNEHDRDIISNGVEIPPIFPHQATVDGL